MTAYSPPVKILATAKRNTLIYTSACARTHTRIRTVSQVKVMDLKNVLISSLYTISILPPLWLIHCVCRCAHAHVRTCICADNELMVPSEVWGCVLKAKVASNTLTILSITLSPPVLRAPDRAQLCLLASLAVTHTLIIACPVWLNAWVRCHKGWVKFHGETRTLRSECSEINIWQMSHSGSVFWAKWNEYI